MKTILLIILAAVFAYTFTHWVAEIDEVEEDE